MYKPRSALYRQVLNYPILLLLYLAEAALYARTKRADSSFGSTLVFHLKLEFWKNFSNETLEINRNEKDDKK